MSDNPQNAATDARGEPVSLGNVGGHEIYPMPMFAKLAVSDVAAASEWYQQALGFVVIFQAPSVAGQPAIVHLRRRKYQDLLLVPARGAESAASPALWLNFNADGEVDELAARARSVPGAGISSVDDPVNTPWNTRDLNVVDPAGNRLVFTGRNPNPDPEQAARMRAMLDRARSG